MCPLKPFARRGWRQAEDQTQGDHADHRQALDVDQRQSRRAQVHQRPLVGGRRRRRGIDVAGRVVVGQDARADQRQQDGVRVFVELGRWGADLLIRLGQVGPLGQQRLQARPVDEHSGATPAAVAEGVRRLVEGRLEHARQLSEQPVFAVVVVEHDRPVRRQVGARFAERLLGEQEALQAQAGELRGQRQRVGQGEDDQVVLVGALAQERAPVVDVDVDARVARTGARGGTGRPRRAMTGSISTASMWPTWPYFRPMAVSEPLPAPMISTCWNWPAPNSSYGER